HRPGRGETELRRRVERLLEEGGEARGLDVILADRGALTGLGHAAIKRMPTGVKLEEAQSGGEAIGRVRPASARWIPVEGRAAVGRIVGDRDEAEVDDGELAVADEQIVGLEVLVGDALMLEVVEAREK